MKRRITVVFVFLMLAVVFMGCGENSGRKTRIENYLQLDLREGVWEVFDDTHGGFHGDGSTYGEIGFYGQAADKIRKEIESSDVWEPLPLPEQLDRIVHEYHINETTLSEKIPIPENGYWCFLDRDQYHNGVGELYNFEALEKMKRQGSFFVPFNFVIAFYDAERNVIYCYQHDI